jgi:hypothetical protein
MKRKRTKRINWNKELKNLGVDMDVTIARRLGVSPLVVWKKRQALGIPRASKTRIGRHIDWKKELKNLGVETDSSIARRLGISSIAVRNKRRQLEIPSVPQPIAIHWEKERENLGVDPDNVIAKRVGVTRERVRQVREKLGIPRPPRPTRPREHVRTDTTATPEELDRARAQLLGISHQAARALRIYAEGTEASPVDNRKRSNRHKRAKKRKRE